MKIRYIHITLLQEKYNARFSYYRDVIVRKNAKGIYFWGLDNLCIYARYICICKY